MLDITTYCSCGPGEKPYLRRALKSVGFCSQKIFVSDGCSKESLAVAEELGWDIWEWHGRDSMCERRNFAIGYRGDGDYKPDWVKDGMIAPEIENEWIVQVDDDEVYADNFGPTLEAGLPNVEIGTNAISINLRNVVQDSGRELTSTPLVRIFRRGKVHWLEDIQNELIYKGQTGYFDVKMLHYGYGGPLEHWEKQWKRMPANERRTRSNSKDMVSRGYLINSLAVCGGVGNFERLLAHVTVGIEQYKKYHKGDRMMQIVVERSLRHFYAVCANNGKWEVFRDVVGHVSDEIDWIVDVPFWQLVCAFNIHPIDLDLADKYAKNFLRRMTEHRSPPIMNIEVQSMGEELGACYRVFELFMASMVNSDEGRAFFAKGADWWQKKCLIYYLYDVLRKNGIEPVNVKMSQEEWLETSSEYAAQGQTGMESIIMEIANG